MIDLPPVASPPVNLVFFIKDYYISLGADCLPKVTSSQSLPLPECPYTDIQIISNYRFVFLTRSFFDLYQ
jgi:hypothetical protein